MNYLQDLFSNLYLFGFFAIGIPLLLSLRMFLIIIYSVRLKNLMDDPVERSMHDRKTPTMGGVGIFITFSISLLVWGMLAPLLKEDLIRLLSIIVACIMLLFLGIKDDLIGFSPIKKLIVQAFAAFIVVGLTDLRLVSLEGLFGLYELPYTISVVFTIFIFTFIINAYNLIDGIDGLAGSIALIACIAFGTIFCINQNHLLILVSLTLIGSLLGFLRFNMSKKHRIFMGDSGTMFIGFLLPYFGFSFLSINFQENTELVVSNGIIYALAVLSFPILDTVRVFFIRIKAGKSPFMADKNHIHHRLLSLGLGHRQASFWIAITNCFVIAIAISITALNINLQFAIIAILIPLVYLIPFMMVREEGKLKIVNPKENK